MCSHPTDHQDKGETHTHHSVCPAIMENHTRMETDLLAYTLLKYPESEWLLEFSFGSEQRSQEVLTGDS